MFKTANFIAIVIVTSNLTNRIRGFYGPTAGREKKGMVETRYFVEGAVYVIPNVAGLFRVCEIVRKRYTARLTVCDGDKRYRCDIRHRGYSECVTFPAYAGGLFYLTAGNRVEMGE